MSAPPKESGMSKRDNSEVREGSGDEVTTHSMFVYSEILKVSVYDEVTNF